MNLIETASTRFNEGYNCAQSVLSSFSIQLGLPFETSCRIAAPFGGGIGRLGEVCGAVTGAMLVLGLQFGNTSPADNKAKEKSYRVASKFAELFRNRHKTILCRELIGCDINTPEGLASAREQKIFTVQCPAYVRDAVEILNDLLTET
jgi:C_GCAxxG_C_C family probable redox protein